MKQYETIDWKAYAQQQQANRKAIEQSLTKSRNAFQKAQQMLHKIISYCRKLENDTQHFRSSVQKLQYALKQQRITNEVLQKDNQKLRSMLAQANDKLQSTSESLIATKKKLDFAEQKLQFSQAIELLNSNTVIHDSASENLAQYFEYKPTMQTTQYQ